MIEGNIVILTAYDKEYLNLALKYVNNIETAGFLNPSIPYPLRKEDEEKFYNDINPFANGKYNFAILKKDNKEYIGGCGINHVDWKNSYCTVGIFLGKPFWGKGYGTDAMKTLLDFIFKELNLNKVKLNVFSFNKRAVKSYEKCGFSVEGILRDEVFRHGKYNDVLAMGILRKEWEQKYS